MNYKIIGILILIPIFAILISLGLYLFYFTYSEHYEINCVEDCNFTAVGDVDFHEESIKTLLNIKSEEAEAMLFVGDLGYTTPEDWFAYTSFLNKSKTFIAIGNHDLPKKNYLDFYDLQKPFYSFEINNVYFISLSTELKERLSVNPLWYLEYLGQQIYVNQELEKAQESDFIVVFFHKPMYTNTVKGPVFEFRDDFQPLFDKHGVDLVIQAHSHLYTRSEPLSYNEKIDEDGQVYLVVGTGGREPLHEFMGESDWVKKRFNNEFGYLNFEILDNKLSGKFLNNDGKVIDSFKLNN